jgi:hypothetical protein
MPSDARRRGLARLLLAVAAVVAGILVGAAVYVGADLVREQAETTRTTERFDPPVLAGQLVPGPCANGGFYARDQDTIVLTMAAHCGISKPGMPLRGPDGRLVGIYGELAELAECPAGRFCAPSDIISLVLSPDRIPWGHLNMVDMGAGGYRTITEGTRPLTCADVHEGDPVEVNAREHYRTGKVIAIGPYEHATDTIFPCMLITDIKGYFGDSGAAVMVNGLPAGSTAREISGYLAFTPLAEGLANLGLELCTSPDCGLTP